MAKLDLFFLRHGLADWPNWKESDDDQPLSDEGKSETHGVASFLVDVGVKPQKILTSSLPRASQTADIATEHLRVPVDVKLKKSGVGRIALDRGKMTGQLRWLLTPGACQSGGAK